MVNSLETFAHAVSADWGPLSTELIDGVRQHLERLLRAPATEGWLDTLHRDAPPSHEMYRDPGQRFVLLAHTEPTGLYRPPHDHGRSWVIYGVQQGESVMTTYARVKDPNGTVRLVRRESTTVRPGQVQVYLPGDIHDTRCTFGPALIYRFTERDLKKEDSQEHRITRYVERNGAWVAP
jgi:predicted metal-dependent enzyme (double-stranded beta helix superfamily)